MNWNGEFDFFDENDWDKDVLDIQEGNGVNIVPKDPYKWVEIEDETYDLVMAANAFQHIDYFWQTIIEMKRVAKSGGLIYIIAPSVRYDGAYPHANWAFNDHGMVAIANWADLEIIDHSVAGVPSDDASREWDYELDDAVLIARKKGSNMMDYPWSHLSVNRRYSGKRMEE